MMRFERYAASVFPKARMRLPSFPFLRQCSVFYWIKQRQPKNLSFIVKPATMLCIRAVLENRQDRCFRTLPEMIR